MLIRSILEKCPLEGDGSNFLDWELKLQLIIRSEDLADVLVEDAPVLGEDSTDDEKAKAEKYRKDELSVQGLMLASMATELTRKFINNTPKEMIERLSNMFLENARRQRSKITLAFTRCNMTEGSSVNQHMLKMLGYLEKLEKLKAPMHADTAEDIILGSLPASYKDVVMHLHLREKAMTLDEIHQALKQAEADMNRHKEEKNVLAISQNSKKVQKGKGKKKIPKKNKGAGDTQASSSKGKKKNSPTPQTECFYCHELGHFKANCPKYKADLDSGKIERKRPKVQKGIYVIEINLTTSIHDWVIDTGSCAHICANMQALMNRRILKDGEVILKVGNGESISAIAIGSIRLQLDSGLNIILNNVYYVPSISKNIISVSCLDKDGYVFTISNSSLSISKDGIFYANAIVRNGLYLLEVNDKHVLNVNNKRLKISHENESLLWHYRLGHISNKRIKKLQDSNLLDLNSYEQIETCEPCLIGKMTKKPFKMKGTRAKDLLELIHSDVCGPIKPSARDGFKYFITFTDDYSRFGYVYLMKSKSESFEKFKEFKTEVENQLEKRIKALRTDRGGEYLSKEFGAYLKECGIISQLTPPGTPQWNGVSERRNRTLLDMVRSMMCQAELPLYFWGHALLTAVYTLNVVPSKSVEKTPYELWTGKIPNLSFLKIWGCEAYIKRLMSTKLEPQAEKCFFIGYPKETKGYYFWHKSTNRILVERGAIFLEKEFLERIKSSGSSMKLDENQEILQDFDQDMEDVDVDQSSPTIVPVASGSMSKHVPQLIEEEVHASPHSVQSNIEPISQEFVEEVQETQVEQEEPQELRRSMRPRKKPDFYLGLHEVLVMDTEDPTTFEEAINRDDSKAWYEAMQSEMQSMYDNQVWTLVDLPQGKRVVQNKWVFKRKMDMDGNMTTYKARLVAKGFTQVQGIDYDETFSPVAMFKSIRILLAIAAFYDYEIWQMDVKTAFLNGNLEEDVYMVQPRGFEDPKNSSKVCKLHRSIYGLKQASRSWNKRFNDEVKRLGFKQSQEEPCVYKMVSGSYVLFLVLYVDDILLIGNFIPLMEQIKSSLKDVFSMKDLGEAQYILGIKICRDRSRRLIGLSQRTYIDKVLKRFNMRNSKKGNVPMTQGVKLSKSQCATTRKDIEIMKDVPYASAVGSIMYAMVCTRPDVAYALSMTSRHQAHAGPAHWTAVKNILKYINRTKDKFLVYGGKRELVVEGYSDASFANDCDDTRSQSGYVFILNGGAVCWRSFKQSTTADSTTQSEVMAAAEASKEGVWIKKFIEELGVVPSSEGPLELFCDNSGAIAQIKEPKAHHKIKHMDRKYFVIRDFIDEGRIKLLKVDTDSNTADPLTKPLSQAKSEIHFESMGLRDHREWIETID